MLLAEAARLHDENGTSEVVDFSTELLAKRVREGDSEYILLPNTGEMRQAAFNLSRTASVKLGGVWAMYCDELYAALGKKRRRWWGWGKVYDLHIDVERRIDPRKRGDAVDFDAISGIIRKLRAKSDSWRFENLHVPAYGYPAEHIDPETLSQRRTSRFLMYTYIPMMRKVMRNVNNMTSEAVRGVVDFLTDYLDILSAFGYLDDYIDDFIKLGWMMWAAHGVDRINRSLRSIYKGVFEGSDEKTAMAIMGHQVSSMELMRWVLGHRISGFNVMRMHGDLAVLQIGCAVENLLRAVKTRDPDMAYCIVDYLQEEVCISEADPVAKHAHLTVFNEAVQKTLGLYYMFHNLDRSARELSYLPQEVREKLDGLNKLQEKVSSELTEFKASLIKRAGGRLPPSPLPPRPRRKTMSDGDGVGESSPPPITPLSPGPSGSTACMLPSIGAVVQQGAITTSGITRGA